MELQFPVTVTNAVYLSKVELFILDNCDDKKAAEGLMLTNRGRPLDRAQAIVAAYRKTKAPPKKVAPSKRSTRA